jgi:hypothetical protein
MYAHYGSRRVDAKGRSKMGTNHRGFIRGELLAEYLRHIGYHLWNTKVLVINGYPLSKRQMRRLDMWENEGTNVAFKTVDQTLTGLEWHIDLFFNWCETEKGECPWAGEEPPLWWERAAA